MVEVERPHETVIVVRQGLMDPALVEEFNQVLAEATHTGRWQRHDDPFGEARPHPAS